MNIAAREQADRIIRGVAFDLIVLNTLSHILIDLFHVQQHSLCKGLAVQINGHNIVPHGQILSTGKFQTVFRNGRDAQLSDLPDAQTIDGGAVDTDIPVADWPHTAEKVGHFTLPVAFHAGNSQNFAGPDRKIQMVDHWTAFLVLINKVFDFHNLVLGALLPPLHLRDNIPPHNHAGQTGLIQIGYQISAHDTPSTKHGHTAAQFHYLPQLVGDKDNRVALIPEKAQLIKELLCLLRREDRGGLVQNQNFDTADELLEDLHFLPHADTQILDLSVRVHMELVFLSGLHGHLPGLFLVKNNAALFCGLNA